MGRITQLTRITADSSTPVTEEQMIESIVALKRPTAIMLVGASTIAITDIETRLFNLLNNYSAVCDAKCDIVLSDKIKIPNGVSTKNLCLILETDQETSMSHEKRHNLIEDLHKIGIASVTMIYIEYDGENSCYSDSVNMVGKALYNNPPSPEGIDLLFKKAD